MNLIRTFCRMAAISAAVAASSGMLTSCAEKDYPEGGNSGQGDNEALEIYTRAFIKEFGIFKGKPWSEAVGGAITVRTSKPTPVNVFADIDGQRFIFASMGSVNGAQPIVMNLPSEVKEVIVEANGQEYTVALGKVLDLTNGSRYYVENQYLTELPIFGDFKITPQYNINREIGFSGSKLKTWINDDWAFKICDSKFNFYETEYTDQWGKISTIIHTKSSRFKLAEDYADFAEITVYPLYWRENVHGESDYLLGIYYYSAKEDKELPKLKMIDLDGFDLTQAVKFQKNGDGEYVVAGTKAPYDVNNIKNPHKFSSKGCHITFENQDKNNMPNFGFYIKSGLKPGSTPEKGRNYTHISFQTTQYNAMEWGDNYWDRPMSDVQRSYTGGVLGNRNMVNLDRDKPDRLDGLTNTIADLGTDPTLYYPVGFMSQPKGVSADTDLDFCDVVIAVNTLGGTTVGHSSMPTPGETFGTYPWTLAAEDLGSTDDWDFNDLVVNVYDLTTDFTRPYTSSRGDQPTPTILGRRITVVPRAAGGTFPIYLMYEGEVADDITDETMLSAIDGTFKKGTYVVGTELHAWLGEPNHTQMLNTTPGGKEYDGCAVSFCVPIIGTDRLDFDIQNPPQDVGLVNQTLRNFWVLVDKKDAMRDQLFNYEFDRTPLDPEYTNDGTKIKRNLSQTVNVLKHFDGKLGEGAYRVNPPSENGNEAPQMLMCHYRWKWPVERANIGEVYERFRDWVAGRRTTWQGNPNLELGESNNGYDPTKVCDGEAIVWMQ